MLTSTYTLVALSIEQAGARMSLQSVLERWHPDTWPQAAPAPRQFELACDALRVAFDNCHWRKLDKFVVPALRRSGAAEGLLAELDALSLAAIEARADAHAAAAVRDDGFGEALERCCRLLLERLEREERELFPLARTHISSEAWFAIANQMMVRAAWEHENRGYATGPTRPMTAAAAAMARSAHMQTPAAAPQHGPLHVPHYAAH